MRRSASHAERLLASRLNEESVIIEGSYLRTVSIRGAQGFLWGFRVWGLGFGVQGYRVLDVSIVEELSWDLSILKNFVISAALDSRFRTPEDSCVHLKLAVMIRTLRGMLNLG